MTRGPARPPLAILVHEVRSPVAALEAIAEAFADARLESSSRRELARLAIAACRGIDRVIADVAVTTVRVEAVDAGALVHEAVAAAALGGARVEARVPAELPPVVGDPIRLRQALDNLISNALTHGRAEDGVLVTAAAAGPEVRLAVSDSGAGIPVGQLARIFEAGVRLDEDRPGAGLGLAVTRAIVEAHGGTLTVTSIPGEGATFTIALPVGES